MLTFCNGALGDDWPQFLGPKRDGTSAETGLVDNLPAKVPVVWQFKAGNGFSGPVVAGGRVYLFEQTDGQAVLRCLKTQNAEQVWESSYPCRFIGGLAGGGPGPRATPVIDGDRIYTLGPQGVLRCLNLADGSLVWSRDLKRELDIPDGFFGISSTPLVYNDKLIINAGGAEAGILAIDCKTGRTIWSATDDEASYASPVATAVNGRAVAYVFARSGLHCLDIDQGESLGFFRWRARINASVNAATPILIGNKAFITSSYNTGAALVELGDERLKPVWQGQDILSSQYNTPVYFDGCLIGIDGRADIGIADLVCIEAQTGKRRWTQSSYGCASILLADGKLILFSDTGELELARASTEAFESLGKAKIFSASDCRAHPALADRQLYLRGPNQLLRIDLSKK